MTELERINDLKNRFKNLTDMRHAYHTLYPDGANPALWMKELLENGDKLAAEQLMKDIEAKDVLMKNIRVADKVKEDIADAALERIKALDINAVDPALKDILIVLRSRM